MMDPEPGSYNTPDLFQDMAECDISADCSDRIVCSSPKQESHQSKFTEQVTGCLSDGNNGAIGELKQLFSSRVVELEKRTKDLQALQDEAVTMREEMTFKDHRNSELKQAVLREKDQRSSLEREVQDLVNKLAVEVEKNTKLSSELQEERGGKQELVAVLKENARLVAEVQQLKNDLQSQLQSHERQMEKTQKAISGLVQQMEKQKQERVQEQVQVQEQMQSMESRMASLECSAATARRSKETAEGELRQQELSQAGLPTKQKGTPNVDATAESLQLHLQKARKQL